MQLIFILLQIFMPSNENMNSQDLPSCILVYLHQVEECEYDFDKLQDHYLVDKSDPEASQFCIETGPCFSKLTFVKTAAENQVSTLLFEFSEEDSFSYHNIESATQKFSTLPPSPSGTWSSILMLETEDLKYGYTMIVESQKPMVPETVIGQMTVRIDY